MHAIDTTLESLAITLPTVAKPAANYLSTVIEGNQLFISGQLPIKDGALAYTGKVDGDAMIPTAQEAARWCGINLLAQIKDACDGEWERFGRLLKLGVFVNAPSGFTKAHLVANGVSDLLVEVLGKQGEHGRSAVCVSELPLGAMVEVDAIACMK